MDLVNAAMLFIGAGYYAQALLAKPVFVLANHLTKLVEVFLR